MIHDKMWGDFLKSWREKMGYTEEDLAKLLGVDKKTIKRWEKNETYLPLDFAIECCRALKRPLKDLKILKAQPYKFQEWRHEKGFQTASKLNKRIDRALKLVYGSNELKPPKLKLKRKIDGLERGKISFSRLARVGEIAELLGFDLDDLINHRTKFIKQSIQKNTTEQQHTNNKLPNLRKGLGTEITSKSNSKQSKSSEPDTIDIELVEDDLKI
ncbi:helix-turn-helix transcriptional regulator [Crocosphaera sp.]|uniref:helix-turn-helix transcriptional regulator n=1 Tax=Crocosphaera sp. TaxID=2729996 RepID=UPI003F1F0287|nr:helix-turn-helix transcriptional regulator [Crocosphaera sp.]